MFTLKAAHILFHQWASSRGPDGLSGFKKYLHSQRKNNEEFGCICFTVYHSLQVGFSQNTLPPPLLPCKLQLQIAKTTEECR